MALPVFTSRMFRHGGIYCHADAGIERPEDLRGKVVGTPEYQLTAGVWIRGILADQHGVPVDSVALPHRRPGDARSGREGRRCTCPPSVRHQPDRPGPDALADAGRPARSTPSTRPRIPAPVRRAATRGCAGSSPTSWRAEKEYFARDRDLPDHARRGGPARRLRAAPLGRPVAVQGAAAAKQEAYGEPLRLLGAALHAALAEPGPRGGPGRCSATTTGPTGWTPTATRSTTFLRYHHEQGLSRRLLRARGAVRARSRTEAAVI